MAKVQLNPSIIAFVATMILATSPRLMLATRKSMILATSPRLMLATRRSLAVSFQGMIKAANVSPPVFRRQHFSLFATSSVRLKEPLPQAIRPKEQTMERPNSSIRSKLSPSFVFEAGNRRIARMHLSAIPVVLEPLIVCGPSGVGKGTIIDRFMKDFGGENQFAFAVSHTTRKQRPGEIDGVHYHFVTMDEMEALLHPGKNYFLEQAQVHGNYYGTSWQSILNIHQIQGKHSLLDIDVQGVQRVKELIKSNLQQTNEATSEDLSHRKLPFQIYPKYVFIAPPSHEVLRERLLNRNTESTESIERRTANAIAEIQYGMSEGTFDAIIINDSLEQATQEFHTSVQRLYTT
jgi:guanylate kinase